MIKVTLEFSTLAEASAALALLGGATPAAAKPTKPPVVAVETLVVTQKPVTASEHVAAENAAATKPEPEGVTAQQLTNAIVGAVGKLGRDPVIALLKDKFNVSAGKEITDPTIRAKAVAAINELAGA